MTHEGFIVLYVIVHKNFEITLTNPYTIKSNVNMIKIRLIVYLDLKFYYLNLDFQLIVLHSITLSAIFVILNHFDYSNSFIIVLYFINFLANVFLNPLLSHLILPLAI